MASWQDGYITDIPYTAGFYRELAPPYLHFLSLLMGLRAGPAAGRAYRYCELGCGQGLGTMILAAANPLGDFYGYDFNPAQIAKASDLVERAGLSNMHFVEESFATLAAKSETTSGEPFDLIVLHGIYSWINADNQRHIVRFIRERLKPGGMVYVSYNSMPGWAAFAPVQRLMHEFVSRRTGRSHQGVDEALEFVNQLSSKGARYFQSNERVTRNLTQLAGRDPAYLAHEYLNAHWQALYHMDVARQMEEARLDYVGSATVSDNIVALSTPRDILEMLNGVDSAMAETIKDFAVNRQFRRDLFVRGPIRLTQAQFIHDLEPLRFVLTTGAERVRSKLNTAVGEISTSEPILEPIFNRLKTGPASFQELLALPALAGLAPPRVGQVLSLLLESGQAHPLLESGAANPQAAQALNAVLIESAVHDDSMQFLASPLLGSGVFVSQIELLVLMGLRTLSVTDASALARYVLDTFKAQNKRLMKDKHPLVEDSESLAELEQHVRDFLAIKYPLLQALKVVSLPS